MQGTAIEAGNAIHPDSPFYNSDLETYALDVDKANALLDEAGFSKDNDGTRFGLTIDFGWPALKPHSE
jgi:peptide/nickel transport system substrate-binding protein